MHAARAVSGRLGKGNDVAESKVQQNGQKKVLNGGGSIFRTQQFYILLNQGGNSINKSDF
jgi:hypothetical protein